jgi:hypothetical protein
MRSIPVFSASFAGWTPLFADVNLKNGNFDLENLEKVLSENQGTVGAVVPVHMFGQVDDTLALKKLCQRYGATLVEDLALSMGSRRGESLAGTLGDVTCLSFVRKILPLEMGGALLTNDDVLSARARNFLNTLPPPLENSPLQVQELMKTFHSLTGAVAEKDWADKDKLSSFEEKFRCHLLAGTSEEDWADSIILDELEKLTERVQARRVRAEVYETVFSHPRIQPLENEGSCFFAYPVRLLGVAAEDFLSFSEERGCVFRRIAYPDIHPIFGPRRVLPNATLLEKEVVGLPVDEKEPVSACWGYAQDFLQLFKDYLSTETARTFYDCRGKLEQRMGRF